MTKTLHIGQYYPAQSFLHSLDPRNKILICLIYVVAVFFARTWSAFLPLVVFALLAVYLSRVPPKAVLRALRGIFFILIFAGLMNLFFTPGEELWSWRILIITKEGLHKSGMMLLRLLLLVGVSSLLTLTTSPLHLTHGMERLLQPWKKIGVPAHELSMMLSIGLRFIPILMDEMDIIIKAQRARGADLQHGPVKERLQGIITVIVPLFVSALKRAEELAEAMEARGYHGGEGRTTLYELFWEKTDTAAMICTAVMVALVIIL